MGRGMKNKIKSIFKILVVTAGCLMFASFSPSLDGRAVVVDSGVFPQGLFAKTVGYLPGDIISVTNIAGDTTIDLLVIGALDPSEGVAIMLSPEAADAMGIDRGSNNIVKITKRSGQDERVYGNAVISKSAAEIEDWDDESFESIGAEENSDAFVEPEVNADAAVAEAPLLADAVEEPEAFDDTAETEIEEEDFDEAIDEAPVEEAPLDEAVPEETALEEAAAEEDEAVIEEDFEDEALPEEEFAAEEPEELAEEAFEEESFEADELPEAEEFTEEEIEEAADTAEAEPEEALEEEAFAEEEAEAEAFDSEELDELPAETEEEAAIEEPEEEAFDEALAEETLAEEAFTEESPEALPVEEVAEAEEEAPAEEAFNEDELEALPEESVNADVEEYEAIVLVPADSNPPEGDSDEVEDVISEDELESIDEEITLVPETPLYSTVEEPLAEIAPASPAETKPAASNATSYDKYIVPSLSQLESGKYYIQIAAYGSDENILEVINKYGNNYPITLVPMAGGKTKQVLIGPVTMDEYKVVLERFKSYGFKDAFLRKVR